MKTLEQLLADVTALETKVTALTGERDAAQTALGTAKADHDTALAAETAKVTALTTERDTLKAEAGTLKGEVTALKQSQANFDLRLAEELTKHGIRKEGITTNHKATEDDGAALVKKASARVAALS